MKRDMDLVRKILLALEEHEHGFAPREFDIEGYAGEQIAYHAYLMDQAGLIEAANTTHMGSSSPEAMPRKMTWEGHEFLDAARSETIWNKARQKIKEAGGSVTISTLTALLKKLTADALGI